MFRKFIIKIKNNFNSYTLKSKQSFLLYFILNFKIFINFLIFDLHRNYLKIMPQIFFLAFLILISGYNLMQVKITL